MLKLAKVLLLIFSIGTTPAKAEGNSLENIFTSTEKRVDILKVVLAEKFVGQYKTFTMKNSSSAEVIDPITKKPKTTILTSTTIVVDILIESPVSSKSVDSDTLINVNSINVVSVGSRIRIVIKVKDYYNYEVSKDTFGITIRIQGPPPSLSFIFGDKTPEELLELAKLNYKDKDYENAAANLNTLLLMPPNPCAEEGQKLIGEVYEASGEAVKAKNEYRIFLSAFPLSKSLTQIKERLLALEIYNPELVVDRSGQEQSKVLEKETRLSGYVSEYLYLGSTSDKSLRWSTTERDVMSNVKLSALHTNENMQYKIVYKASFLRNLSNPNSSRHQVSSAYVDIKNYKSQSQLRVGNQDSGYPITAGRFLGVALTQEFNRGTKASFIVGEPVVISPTSKRIFYATGLDISSNTSDYTLNYGPYVLRQYSDSLPERNVIGGHVEFASGEASTSISGEYDTLYRAINYATLQTTFHITDSTSAYLLVDERRSPMLYGDQASKLLGEGSVPTLKWTLEHSSASLKELYRYVESITPVYSSYVAGLTRALNKTWTGYVGGQYSSTSTDPTTLSKQSNISKGLDVKISGSNVLVENDAHTILVAGSRSTDSKMYSGTIFNGRTLGKLKLDFINRGFIAKRQGTSSRGVSSSFKINYNITDTSSVESQYSVSRETDKANQSFFVGYQHAF
jgi:hypothetical protein